MIVKIDCVSKRYKEKVALTDFSATLKNGVYGLLGQNGAGKTTIISIITGILKPNAGRIYADGTDIAKLGLQFVSQIGYLPQYPQFYKGFGALEFLKYICAIKDIPPKEGYKRAEELLEVVNLSHVAHKRIGTFSGGMRQRLGIAQAMINNPAVLILDEPTAGLDPKERIRFRNLISKFSKDRIVLLATHIVSDIEYIASEVILLREGHVIKQDRPAVLMDEINSKVWDVAVNDDEVNEFMELYSVSNIVREERYYHLRIVSDQKPTKDAVQISPNLEDVFLYHCAASEAK